MPTVRYNGKVYKFPYTRKGRKKAAKLRRQSKNSMSAFSAGDNCYKIFK